jgi:glutamyl-tRNA synthetase
MVRVRFAPSPTGEPHVGSAWTALFNWLYARRTNGKFILRIEDTDRERLVPGTVERIYELLDWLKLTPDEGPREGGPHAPYIQSERLPLYREHAEKLLTSGAAYRCFCTTERLQQLRAEQQGRGEAPMYDRRCRSIPAEESEYRARTEPFVIRFAVPDGTTEAHDEIRGTVRWGNATLDDTVLLKSDGYPTYHLANVVDDHAMAITHVIRAEEWLPSLPKHLLLYRAFGWEPPIFAHLPLILGPDRKKLSKRHGHTAALEYQRDGRPDAFRNFRARLGWRPPTSDQEICTRDELITRVLIPRQRPGEQLWYRKVGTRRAQSISKVVMAGRLLLRRRAGELVVHDAALAAGSVAPTTVRLRHVEAVLGSGALDAARVAAAGAALVQDIAPISDIRSDADYRRTVSRNILVRWLSGLARG